MSDELDPMDDDLDDSGAESFYAKRRSRWPFVLVGIGILAAFGAYWLYSTLGTRGLSVKGAGHVVVLPDAQGGAWAMMLDGTVVPIEPASVQRLQLKTGPCDDLDGALVGERLVLDSATCTPGPLQKRIGERLKRMGLKFAYFPDEVKYAGDSLEPALGTPEIVASLNDPRPAAPQLVPLYTSLFPQTMVAARASGKLPPPLLIEVKRDDLQIRRMTRTELSQFLARPTFHFAGGAAQGGWVLRTLEVDPAADAPLEKLLLDPAAPPWPEKLQMPTLRVSRQTPLPASAATAAAPPADGRPSP